MQNKKVRLAAIVAGFIALILAGNALGGFVIMLLAGAVYSEFNILAPIGFWSAVAIYFGLSLIAGMFRRHSKDSN
jgi:hypothetical protein